jgi:hypothetical protein
LLEAKGGHGGAQVTLRLCDLNDERKVELRGFRREAVAEALRVLREGPGEIEWLAAWLVERRGDDDERAHFRKVLAELGQQLVGARNDLRRHLAVPRDAPSSCACGDTVHHALPPGLARQMIEVA